MGEKICLLIRKRAKRKDINQATHDKWVSLSVCFLLQQDSRQQKDIHGQWMNNKIKMDLNNCKLLILINYYKNNF